MPNMSEMFPSKWLKAADLGGRELKASIERVTQEEFEDRDKGTTEHKWVLWFAGASKGLILNLTNARAVADFYADDTDGWIGRQITLFVASVSAFGKTTDAIRVKVTPENMQAATGAPAQAAPQGQVDLVADNQMAGAAAGNGAEDNLPF